jgi:Peptidase_C39 like family/Tetratricopeptide repeat
MQRSFPLLPALLACMTCACSPRSMVKTTDRGASLVSVSHIENVPFFPDNTDQCGPASLASVLTYWGKITTPADLKKEVYVPKLKGTLPMDMRPLLKSRGLNAHVQNGDFELVKEEIQNDRPVIAYLDFGTKKKPIGHFVVITGFDDHRRGLIIHSSLARDKFASYRRFRRGWSDTKYWMLTVSPLDETSSQPEKVSNATPIYLPGLTADDLYLLGSAYENEGHVKQAAENYQTAIERDGKHIPSLLALGNQAFDRKEYKQAKKYYHRVIKIDPHHGGANNNLAMVYLKEERHLDRAEKHAKLAAQSEGYAMYANDTLQQIYLVTEKNKNKALN